MRPMITFNRINPAFIWQTLPTGAIFFARPAALATFTAPSDGQPLDSDGLVLVAMRQIDVLMELEPEGNA